jgi:hypothetical protein
MMMAMMMRWRLQFMRPQCTSDSLIAAKRTPARRSWAWLASGAR